MTDALRDACAESMHVVLPNGEMYVGDRAVVHVYEQLGYGAVALFRLPPLSWATPWMYKTFANNRRFFSRFVFRP